MNCDPPGPPAVCVCFFFCLQVRRDDAGQLRFSFLPYYTCWVYLAASHHAREAEYTWYTSWIGVYRSLLIVSVLVLFPTGLLV